tara:strand:- start:150 stop:356 length:207 start_codon:yes stop_codon:yes gene_type:complete
MNVPRLCSWVISPLNSASIKSKLSDTLAGGGGGGGFTGVVLAHEVNNIAHNVTLKKCLIKHFSLFQIN